jgi:Tol biopolymer transport system component
MKRISLIAVVGVAALALSAASGQASAPSRIVFTADQAPSVSGEIYRIDPNGHEVDLSNSPFQDSGPVVSSDGKRVAFFSDRGGAVSVWEVGIDGSGLVQVGPSLVPASTWQQDYSFGSATSLAWQPGGNRLALVDGGTLFILQPGKAPSPVLVGKNGVGLGPWSPDGSILVAWDYAPQLAAAGVAHALSPDGKQLWSVSGVDSPYWAGWSGDTTQSWSWSRGGLLALPIGGRRHPTLRVYDESGHLDFAVHDTSGRPGWSPDGKLLAVVVGDRAEVFTAAGRRILRSRSGISRPMCRQVTWASNRRFIVGGFVPHGRNICGAFGVAVRSGKVSSASSVWFGRALSADRKLAAAALPGTNKQIPVGVRSTGPGVFRAYARVPACGVRSLQFAGSSRSLVYATSCPFPPILLYSVAPDGSGLQQVATPDGFQQPALSPDGTRIGYSDGSAIRILNGDGTHIQVTHPPTACTAPGGEKVPYHDTAPSWSPDGTAIVFTRTDCNGGNELYTVAAASGGVGRSLGLAGDQPAWGPSKIAYIGQTNGENTGIWTANPDGTDPTHLAPNGRDPAWSPDGQLAYLTNGNTAVVNSTPTQLPFTNVTSLDWSPDSTHFAVTASTPTDPFDIYTINTDGSDPTQLTPNYDALDLAGWR